jgi:hypothetical protein
VASYASPPCSPCTRLRFSRVSRHSSGKSASVLTRRGRHFLEKRAVAWVSTMGHRGFGASAIVSRRLPNVPFRHPPTAGQSALESGFFGSRRARGRCALARTGHRHLEHTGSLLNRGSAVLPPAQGTGPSRAPGKHEPSKLRQVHCAHGWHTPEYPGEIRDRPPNSFENDGIHATNGGNTKRTRTHPERKTRVPPRGPLPRCGRSPTEPLLRPQVSQTRPPCPAGCLARSSRRRLSHAGP